MIFLTFLDIYHVGISSAGIFVRMLNIDTSNMSLRTWKAVTSSILESSAISLAHCCGLLFIAANSGASSACKIKRKISNYNNNNNNNKYNNNSNNNDNNHEASECLMELLSMA